MPLPCAPLWFSIPHITQISDTVSKKEAETNWFLPLFGGDKRDRTADLLNAIQALSQLSYTPEYFVRFPISPQRKIYITRQIAICQQEN